MKIRAEEQEKMKLNQYWIDKVIKDGNYHFLPSQRIPGLSIGEYIETRYEAEKTVKAYAKRMRG